MTGRKYETTHPWLTFKTDLSKASARFWIALGEAQSKCHHIAGVPLRPETAKNLHLIYLARGIMATTAIEGNTLTEQEVRDRIDKKLKLPPSREYLGKEVDNILAACNGILNGIESHGVVPVSRATLEDFNSLVLRVLQLEENVAPGKIRKHSVGVGTYRCAPWEDCEYLVERLCEWLNKEEFIAPKGEEVIYGLIKSIVAHVYFVWVHPFADGNGRTARLLEVKFLLEAGVPSAAAHLLSNHYNLTRTEYYRQLDYTSQSKGDLLPFIEYAVRGFVDQLREQIDTIKQQQLQVSWINYVHEQFGGQKTPAHRRQLAVVLAMSERGGFIKPSEIKQLTSQIATDYATKTPKTVSRDVNRLKKMGLIESGVGGYRAKTEMMIAFLPRSINKRGATNLVAANDEKKEEKGQLDLALTLPSN